VATREASSHTRQTLAPLPARVAGGGLRLWLAALVLAWGMQAIVTQSLLLREAMVLMYGSEFAWGVVLSAWLLGIAAGAAVGGRLAGALARRGGVAGVLTGVLLALSVAAALELWIFRGARGWLGVGPGELLPLMRTIVAALLFVSPVSALVGMAFPLACAVVPKWAAMHSADGEGAECSSPVLSFGQVYAIESGGSLIGGAAFSFWAVEHLAPIQVALLCGAATAAASAGFLIAEAGSEASFSRRGRRPLLASALLGGLAAAAVLISGLGGASLDRWLVERRWKQLAPGYELVAATESKYQNLALGRRAGQFSLYCDGHVTADFPDPYTFAPLAHFWMCQHPAPRQVLVLGGGTEGLLSEILRHPVGHVDCVEPDPRQIELVKPYLPAADRAALSDPRVAVHAVDARHYVKMQRARFDLVLARLPEPTSALRARFYTDEFYAELRRAMTPQAVLCLTAAAAPTELSALTREYLGCLRETLGRHFPELIIGWGDPAQVLAATAPGLLTTDPAEMGARYARRGVNSPMFDPAWFAGATDWLEPGKLARRAADLDAAGGVPISSDLRPSIYLQRLALWEAAAGAGSGRRNSVSSRSWFDKWWAPGVIARLRSVRLVNVGGVLAALGGLVVVAGRLRRRARDGWAAGAIGLSVASTGFATMSLSILWLFAFQNLYGYVYQRIGWIIAMFMAGLVLGCTGASRSRKAFWGRLIGIDSLLALLAAAVPFVWRALAALQNGPRGFTVVEVCISAVVIATGLLGGAAFTLAGRLQLEFSRGAGPAAGTVVSADHAGACLGALLCGLLLVPVFGVLVTALLLGGVKLVSALLLCVTWRSR
jgi:spermidine synthase